MKKKTVKNTFSDESSIRRLKAQARGIEYFCNSKQKKGRPLALRVSPKGKKTFFLLYYSGGITQKYSLGVWPSMSLAEAKKLAIKYGDRDPIQERKDKKVEAEKKAETDELQKMAQPRMNDLWKEYSSLPRYRQKAPATRREELRKWRTNIKPTLGSVAVESITPVMINTLIKDLAKKSPVGANRLFSFLKVLFRPALEDGMIDIHPMQHLSKPSGEKPRKRYLSDEEIKLIWPHMDSLSGNHRDILRLGLLTCQRPGEISSMMWKDVDLEKRIWSQSENKTNSSHIVPLSQQVVDILSAREKKGKWVFPSTYNRAKGARTGHSRETKASRKKLCEWAKIQWFTAHDLRRTSRTLLSRLRIKNHVRERLLNHSQGGIQAVYDQFDYLDEKTKALDLLGREIGKIVGLEIEAESKVIPIRRAV
jgi:integrase